MPQMQTRKESRQIPIQYRAAPVGPVNREARTAELIFSTGAAVQRRDWWTGERYLEELSLEPSAVRMDRFANGGVSILDSHNAYELAAILGVAESGSVDGKQGMATARFSKRAEVEPYFQDVADGILRHVSVGYMVHRYEKTDSAIEGGMATWRAIDWEPCEISLVSVPADAGAGFRAMADHPDDAKTVRTFPCEFVSEVVVPTADADPTTNRKEPSMADENKPQTAPATASTAGITEDQQRAAIESARTAEQTRCAEIQTRGVALGIDAAVIATITTGTRTLDEAKARMADHLADKAPKINPVNARIENVQDETDTQRAAVQDALLHRANPAKHKLGDAARQYRGMNLIDMARDRIEAAGGNTRSLSRREVAIIALNLDRDLATRAGLQSVSDFPNILASTVNRTLRAGYEQYPRTFPTWARRSTAPDFRQVARVQMSEMSAFQTINEGGEYKRLIVGDSSEKYSLAKSGGIVAITWETLINDDLGAFDRIPTSLGDEAAATESDIVYAILIANAAMSDTVALFHATHGNLPTASAITDVSLGLARAAMRKQTGLKGRVLNIAPDILLVGPDKEVEANKYTSASFVAAKASDINPNFNTSLEVVVDPRITGNKWFLIAKPARVDTIEYAYLEGEDGLYTEQRQGFEVDGLEIKARMVFAAKAIDWRGMQYNSGL